MYALLEPYKTSFFIMFYEVNDGKISHASLVKPDAKIDPKSLI